MEVTGKSQNINRILKKEVPKKSRNLSKIYKKVPRKAKKM